MTSDKKSGNDPFVFSLREDLSHVPEIAKKNEPYLHGTFSIDPRPGKGELFYGMPRCGIMRVEKDLGKQDIIPLPDKVKPFNFHSTKFGFFDGKWRLYLPANDNQSVVVLTPEGELEFILPRPEFEQYKNEKVPYLPTDTLVVDDKLLIADGYGANYISSVDLKTNKWASIFGGLAKNANDDGHFATAHGLTMNPVHHHLDIADRPNARIQNHHSDGKFIASRKLAEGAWPCGIRYFEMNGRHYAAIGCLMGPDKEKPAPIYIIDAETYEVLSTIKPKEELGVELCQHLHNVILHVHDDQMYLVCQSWNPGHYFVLQKI